MDLPQEKDVKQYQNTKLSMKLAQKPKEDSALQVDSLPTEPSGKPIIIKFSNVYQARMPC